MGFTKIEEADIKNKGVMGLPDAPNLSVSDLQKKFDELAVDVIIPKFNNLIDEMEKKELESAVISVEIKRIRRNKDNQLEISLDGVNFETMASAGHFIIGSHGEEYPARGRLQFLFTHGVEDDAENNTTKIIGMTVTNNLLATLPGTALDAVQGKVLDDKIYTNAKAIASIPSIIYATEEPTEVPANTIVLVYEE